LKLLSSSFGFCQPTKLKKTEKNIRKAFNKVIYVFTTDFFVKSFTIQMKFTLFFAENIGRFKAIQA